MVLVIVKYITQKKSYFSFKTKNIEIKENGDLIKAYNGKAVSKDGILKFLQIILNTSKN